MPEPLLEVRDVHASYGKFDVLRGVNLKVLPGEMVCMIGPNGAGKSTVLKTIFGLLTARRGAVHFDGVDITRWNTGQILRRGIAIVFQEGGVFPRMTVAENMEMGAYIREDHDEVAREVEALCEMFPILGKRSNQMAGTLSGGEQQMLEMARVLLLRPKLLLLDEPTLGLAPAVIKLIYEKIHELNAQGLSFLIVEQNARTALENSHRAYVLENGHAVYEGTGREILDHPEVRRVYLGAFAGAPGGLRRGRPGGEPGGRAQLLEP